MKASQADKPREIQRSAFLTSIRDDGEFGSSSLPTMKKTKSKHSESNQKTFGHKTSSVSPSVNNFKSFRATAALDEELYRTPQTQSFFDVNLVRQTTYFRALASQTQSMVHIQSRFVDKE